jgi:putative tryptophan/tyrosine transport system substrate-binding protein
VRRRTFVAVIGAAAALCPIVGVAQQRAIRLVGLLLPGSPADSGHYAAAFAQGLRETGYSEGENVTIESRWAEGRYERLPQLATDLVNRGVAVIAAGGPQATLAAKSATSTVPIVAVLGDAATLLGLVGSLSRPQGNITGVAPFITAVIWGKRLELLREMIPNATVVAILTVPNDPSNPRIDELTPAAGALGMQLLPVTASTDAEIEDAFGTAVHGQSHGLLVSDQPFFTVRHDRIATLAARHALPAIYAWREYVAGGGLISYGSSLVDAWRQVGVYAGRVLKGERPADLPVQQPTRFELVINLKTAKTLGLTIPPSIIARAEEVIE